MILKWFALTAACAVALFVPSCAHDRQLVDITIHPGGATFTTPDPASQVQFSAIGSFVHPRCTHRNPKHWFHVCRMGSRMPIAFGKHLYSRVEC